MADHDVTFTIPPERSLKRADVEFKVKKNKSTLGTLKVSEGGIEWVAKNKSSGKSLDWETFVKHMIFNRQ